MRTAALGSNAWLAMSTAGTAMWQPSVGSKKQRDVNICTSRHRVRHQWGFC
jgi:hypothetical protein